MKDFKRLIFIELCSVRLVATSAIFIILVCFISFLYKVGFDSISYCIAYIVALFLSVVSIYGSLYPLRDFHNSLVEINDRYKFFLNIWRGKCPEWFDVVTETAVDENKAKYFFPSRSISRDSMCLLDRVDGLYRLRKKRGSTYRKKYNVQKEYFFRDFEKLDEEKRDEIYEYTQKIRIAQKMIDEELLSPYTKMSAPI